MNEILITASGFIYSFKFKLRKAIILSTFLFTCVVDHQARRGFECFRMITNSSNDSIRGAPNVSGNNKDNKAATKVVPPKISKGNSSNAMTGR